MKTELKPGMKVRITGHDGIGNEHDRAIVEVVVAPLGDNQIRIKYFDCIGHIRQPLIFRHTIVSVFRKKKRKKHELWVNDYGPTYGFSAHDKKEVALSETRKINGGHIARIGPAKRYVLAKRQE